MKTLLGVSALVCASTVYAGGWNLTIGPSWRSRVKSEISGRVPVAATSASHTSTVDKEIPGHGNWDVSEVTVVPDPSPDAAPGDTLYSVSAMRTETTVMPGAGVADFVGSDVDAPLGLRASGGYDFDISEKFSVGVSALFAGYWKMESHATGAGGGGTRTVSRFQDVYNFDNGPYPDYTYFGASQPVFYESVPQGSDQTTIPGTLVSSRIRSDLYQLGFGPRATWHATSWLDAYAGVNALCNLAHMKLETAAQSGTETCCRFGLGANLGFAAYFAEQLGLYADVGYEWIDKAKTGLGTAEASVDFSSMIMSIGVAYRF